MAARVKYHFRIYFLKLNSKNLLYMFFTGPVIASQGDRIRCTVMFENENVRDKKKKVPFMFFLNGRKIVTEEGKDHFFLDSDKP